jgi:hypothetical protein
MNVTDEDYSRNMSCTLNEISTYEKKVYTVTSHHFHQYQQNEHYPLTLTEKTMTYECPGLRQVDENVARLN